VSTVVATDETTGGSSDPYNIAGLTDGSIVKKSGTALIAAVAGTDYVFPGGVAGGQTVKGGASASDNLTLSSTSNATKGQVILGSSSGVVFDEVHNRLCVGAAPTFNALEVHSGSLGFTGSETGLSGTNSGFGGSAHTLTCQVGGAEKWRITDTDSNFQWKGSSFLLASAVLATNATDGFAYIPTCAGAPTGTPTAHTGGVAIVWDTTNHKFWVYDGAWKGGTAPGVWS